VDHKAAVTVGAAELHQARSRERATLLRIRLLAVAAIAFVVIGSFQATPAPGIHGAALGVTATLVAFCAATVGAMQLDLTKPAAQLLVLLVAVLSAAALIDLQANHAAFVGVFPAVGIAALVLPVGLSTVAAGAALCAVSVAWLANGSTPISGIILNDFAIVAFYLLWMFARRLRDSNERAEVLLAELEQTRAAQANAAALAERQRLAREMHDVLAHSLSGLMLNLEGARLLARQGGAEPQVGDAIDRAHRLAKTGLEEARRAIGMLCGDALPGPERLDDLAAEFAADTAVACTVAVTGAERNLGSNGRLTVYRVAQEALTNVRKHASAARVEIRLDYAPSGTRLTIEDFDGCGERPVPGAGTADGTGYGLTGMRERAELLGGTLTAGPTDSGYRVDLRVPL